MEFYTAIKMKEDMTGVDLTNAILGTIIYTMDSTVEVQKQRSNSIFVKGGETVGQSKSKMIINMGTVAPFGVGRP